MKNKIFIILFCSISILAFSTKTVDASYYCSAAEVKAVLENGMTNETQASLNSLAATYPGIKTCVCNPNGQNISSTYLTDCQKAMNEKTNTLSNGINGGNNVTLYAYDLSTEKKGDTTVTKYSEKAQEIIDMVKGMVNVACGIIIFVLGFGFIYNLTSIGVNSSNPQQRQIAMKKIGDILLTAGFVGSIPIIMSFILSLMQGIS